MDVAYLIDTNIVSELVRPQPNPHVRQLWQQQYAACAITAVTWHELLYGLERMPDSKRKRGIDAFVWQMVRPLPIYSYDDAAASWLAIERARLVRIGQTPSLNDALIAAIAAVRQLTVVTRNVNDFAGFNGVKIDNWFASSR